jgi:Domain of unknown function (DUF4271)
MIRLFLLTFLLLLTSPDLSGQGVVSNPFELAHRLPAISTVSAPGIAATQQNNNPFDVVTHVAPSNVKSNFKKASKPSTSFVPKISLPKGKSNSGSFLFWALVGALGFLTFAVAANRSVVGKAWKGFLNDNHLALVHREATGLVGSTPYFLLYFNFLLNFGVFAFLVTRSFKGDNFNNISYLLLCVLGATVIFLSKHLLIQVIGWLYPLSKEASKYNFLITIFNCVLGLFLVPFNFLIAFARDFEPFLAFWTLGLVAIFYLYRTFRAGKIGGKFLIADQFHFLLYLCAAEVAPVLLIYKLLTNSAN